MRALFGEGLHPDADRIITERTELYVRAGESPAKAAAAAQQDARLGRRFPRFAATDGAWADDLRTAYAAAAARFGLPSSASLSAAQRYAVHDELALARFTVSRGRPPRDDVELRAWVSEQARPPRQPVAGYDLVFTPVKSVSVLWALGDASTRAQVRAAHEAAISRALEYVECHAARTRTGAGGIAQIATDGLVVAAFEHRDSRSGDPDLHTHCAVSTKVRGRDGQWRSLDGRVLFALGVSASETYNTAIEDELRTRLGVAFAERPTSRDARPVREVSGLPGSLLTAFSSRRLVIEDLYRAGIAAYRRAYGHEPPRAAQARLAQQATLESRGAKPPLRSLSEQRGEWIATAREVLGVAADDAVRDVVAGCVRVPMPVAATETEAADDINVDATAAAVVAAVQEERATWTRWHLQAETERQLRPLAVHPSRRADLVDAVTVAARDVHSLPLAARPTETMQPPELSRADGESVLTVHGAQRYSSHAVLDAEHRLLAAASAPAQPPVHAAAFAATTGRGAGVVGERPDAGQIALARAFACQPRLLIAGIGPAGAGKTAAMRLVDDALAAAGRRVIGVAPSARAADVLASEIGVAATTIHSFLAREDAGKPMLSPGDVLLVDEAGMAGTLRLDRLTGVAARRGAVVRLLGDPQQLAAVESGGALRLIDSEVGAVHLRAVHRFTDPAQAAASLRLRDGHPDGIDYYDAAGRVHAGSRDACVDEAFEGWSRDTAAGRTALMLSARTDVVTELSARARFARIANGELDGTAATVPLHDGNWAGVGDRVVTRRNDRRNIVHGGRDFVKNGDVWTVTAVRSDGSLTVVHAGHRGRVALSRGYVAEDVELAYACTVHRAQGMTVDTTHVLVDDAATRESLYVAVTRGRDANHLHVVTDELLDPDADHAPRDPRTACEILKAVLARDGQERSATETRRHESDAAASLARLVPEYEHAVGVYAEHAHGVREAVTSVLGADESAEVVADPAWPALAAALADRSAAEGRDVVDVLAETAGSRERVSADSVAQVLASRLRAPAALLRSAARSEAAGLPPWVPAPPLAPDDELGQWLAQRAATIVERVDALAAEAHRQSPTWLLTPGHDPPGRATRRAARTVAAYADQYGGAALAATIPGDDPLGPRPAAGGAQRRAWDAATRALRARDTTRDAPSTTTDRPPSVSSTTLAARL